LSLERIILITFLLELIELFFQYAPTFKDSIAKLYAYYKKSPLLFFLVHPSYIWILFLSLGFSNLSFPIIIAIALKIFDIVTKLEIFKKIDTNGLNEETVALLDMKTPIWAYFIGLFTYPYLVYLAFL
jgi:hypothetical protein